MLNRQQLKLDSKLIMKEGKLKLKWQVLLFLLLTITISQLVFNLTGYTQYANQIVESMEEPLALMEEYYETGDAAIIEKLEDAMDDYEDALENYPRVSPVAILIAVLLIVMSSILSAGFEWWCLLNTRRKPNDFRNMLDGFGFTFKLIALVAIRGLLIFIGFMLFFIPGIIFSLAFSQSTYILFEDPKQGIFKCLAKSMKMMNGYKGEYFVLLLSFIGWQLLGNLITSYIASIFALGGLGVLTAYTAIFIGIWLTPYMGLTRAGFYNQISGYNVSQEMQPTQEDNTL